MILKPFSVVTSQKTHGGGCGGGDCDGLLLEVEEKKGKQDSIWGEGVGAMIVVVVSS